MNLDYYYFPDGTSVNSSQLRAFKNYLLEFYGYNGLYPIAGLTDDELEAAIEKYVAMCQDPKNFRNWGDGDSIDRERVRDIILKDGESRFPAGDITLQIAEA